MMFFKERRFGNCFLDEVSFMNLKHPTLTGLDEADKPTTGGEEAELES